MVGPRPEVPSVTYGGGPAPKHPAKLEWMTRRERAEERRLSWAGGVVTRETHAFLERSLVVGGNVLVEAKGMHDASADSKATASSSTSPAPTTRRFCWRLLNQGSGKLM